MVLQPLSSAMDMTGYLVHRLEKQAWVYYGTQRPNATYALQICFCLEDSCNFITWK